MLSEQALELVELVAQLGSFTAAANQQNKVPSAVSYAVKQIEDELGVELFERHHRSVSLTKAGEHFVNESRAILKSMAQLKQRTAQLATGWKPTLSVALDCVVRADKTAFLIRDFYHAFTDVDLIIRKENFNGAWEALSRGRCDVAIGATASVPVGGPFLSKPMGSISWCLVASPSHPLTQQVPPLDATQLSMSAGVCLSDTAWQYPPMALFSLDKQRQLQVPDWVQALNLLRSGIGIGWLPRHLAASFLASGSLVELQPVHPLPDSQCFLLWDSRRQSPALQWLQQYLDNPQDNSPWLG